MPSDSNAAKAECGLTADRQYTPFSGSLSISIEDVVCVVPNADELAGGYKILYLKGRTGLEQEQEQELQLESITVASPPSILSAYLVQDVAHHLQAANIHVVLSVLSGTGRAKNIFRHVLQPLLANIGLEAKYSFHETKSQQTISELASSTFLPAARASIPQTIILLSGDGGLSDIVDVFYSHSSSNCDRNTGLTSHYVPPDVVLIPAGTGNAMATSTSLQRLAGPRSALAALLRGSSRPIPAFAASFSPGAQLVTAGGETRVPLLHGDGTSTHRIDIYGAVVASWGIHAALVADSDAAMYRHFGLDKFKIAARELLYPSDGTETHRYRGIVSLLKRSSDDGNRSNMWTIPLDEHTYVLATMVSNLEKGFVVSPCSAPLDGQLRMVHFGPVSSEETMRLLGLAYQGGQHVRESGVVYEEIEGFKISFREESEKWRRVCIDGKIVVVEEGGWVEVHRDARLLLHLVVIP